MSTRFDHLCTVVENLPHCKKMGLKITALSQGEGSIRLETNSMFVSNQKRNLLHSGVVTTLLDTLSGIVASSAFDIPQTVATLDLRIDHLDRLSADLPLMADAECFHLTEDIAYIRGWAWQENKQMRVAKATGTFMRSGPFNLSAGKNA